MPVTASCFVAFILVYPKKHEFLLNETNSDKML